jgi:hypothetical protein
MSGPKGGVYANGLVDLSKLSNANTSSNQNSGFGGYSGA